MGTLIWTAVVFYIGGVVASFQIMAVGAKYESTDERPTAKDIFKIALLWPVAWRIG